MLGGHLRDGFTLVAVSADGTVTTTIEKDGREDGAIVSRDKDGNEQAKKEPDATGELTTEGSLEAVREIIRNLVK